LERHAERLAQGNRRWCPKGHRYEHQRQKWRYGRQDQRRNQRWRPKGTPLRTVKMTIRTTRPKAKARWRP